MNAPCMTWQISDPSHSPKTLTIYNEVILGGLAKRVPEIEIYDLDARLCDDVGKPLSSTSTGGIVPRPDGIHLSAEGSRWLANEIAEELLGLETGRRRGTAP